MQSAVRHAIRGFIQLLEKSSEKRGPQSVKLALILLCAIVQNQLRVLPRIPESKGF